MIAKIFILLVWYQVKHFMADFPLQNEYMLGKFKETGWVKPLAFHCAVHALFTLWVSCILVSFPMALGLALFDFAAHFGMDRLKASPKLLGQYKALSGYEFKALKERAANNNSTRHDAALVRKNSYFWWSLGFDQMVHHLTHYVIIYFLVTQ